MAIASVSGSSSSVPVRTSMEPIRGVREREAGSEKRALEEKTAEQESEKKLAASKKEFEDAKGVKEVDIKV